MSIQSVVGSKLDITISLRLGNGSCLRSDLLTPVVYIPSSLDFLAHPSENTFCFPDPRSIFSSPPLWCSLSSFIIVTHIGITFESELAFECSGKSESTEDDDPSEAGILLACPRELSR